jgi:ASC-1-like (ASCH) protein/GNAT superfamily N-acetyltransferase
MPRWRRNQQVCLAVWCCSGIIVANGQSTRHTGSRHTRSLAAGLIHRPPLGCPQSLARTGSAPTKLSCTGERPVDLEAPQSDGWQVMGIEVREAGGDAEALAPYYDGDHVAHARRIFHAHLRGGRDEFGYFSLEQKMFILDLDGQPAGMIHVVRKRQDTFKVSPIIVAEQHRGVKGLGGRLLESAEHYAGGHAARQMYCTVSEENRAALQFFARHGYTVAGRAPHQYKPGIAELMMYKPFRATGFEDRFDEPNITVSPLEEDLEPQVTELLLRTLPEHFQGIDEAWVASLFAGYRRRSTGDISQKYKLVSVALGRPRNVLGVLAATPKKGAPIRIMPFVATTLPAFIALLTEMPYLLKPHGRKLYLHALPTVEETIALQQRGWVLEGLLPGAYHRDQVIQQWGIELPGEDFMRLMRVKKHYLSQIRDGKKTLEVRVGYPNILQIQPGERIRLASRTETTVVRVNDVRKYHTIDAMVEREDTDRIAPGLRPQEVSELLRRIYPPHLEKRGVIVLDIQVDPEGPR